MLPDFLKKIEDVVELAGQQLDSMPTAKWYKVVTRGSGLVFEDYVGDGGGLARLSCRERNSSYPRVLN